jgi:hypothetical protein
LYKRTAQQADPTPILPLEKKILICSGDNILFSRYLTSRPTGAPKKEQINGDALVVTHHRAAHFSSRLKITKLEKNDEHKSNSILIPSGSFTMGPLRRPHYMIKGKKINDEKNVWKDHPC